MMNNDVEGCCTISGAGHEEIVFKVLANEPTVVPTPGQCHTVYRGLTGGPDTGLAIANVLAAQQRTGLFSPLDSLAGGGYTRLKEGSVPQLHESVAYFGVAKVGIQCPESAQTAAQQQMQTGQVVPWRYVPSSPIVGGHDIEFVGYDDDGFWAVSWGLLVLVTYSFAAHLIDEAWTPLAKQFRVRGHGPLDLDWPSLDAELSKIAV
jgi:hypothetical protein